MKPRRELSLIVAVKSGPGMRAPEREMTKEEANTVKKPLTTDTPKTRPDSKPVDAGAGTAAPPQASPQPRPGAAPVDSVYLLQEDVARGGDVPKALP
jgi:hypothetical protein